MVREAIKKTRGSAGPSGLDAEGWCRILDSRNIITSNEDLRKVVANMTKRLCQNKTAKHLDAFLACRSHLDKQPDVRPVRITEVLRSIIRKIVMKLLREILNATVAAILCISCLFAYFAILLSCCIRYKT